MKLKLDYNANSKHYDLKIDLDINIEEDAEALGYITAVLFAASQRLASLMETANPKYRERLSKGVAKSAREQTQEENINYPFTTFIQHDE